MRPNTKRNQVIEKILDVLKSEKKETSYTDLVQKVHSELLKTDPAFSRDTVRDGFTVLRKDYSEKIYQPEIGIYILKEYMKDAKSKTISNKSGSEEASETQFYIPIAKFLQGLGECTIAVPKGGSGFPEKWSTPDVIGLYEVTKDRNKEIIEIISAEVKASDKIESLLTGFGQVCNYKLFSHRVYLAIPKDIPKTEYIRRIDALCCFFGIGLILFNRNIEGDIEPEIRTRAKKSKPDTSHYYKYFEYIVRVIDSYQTNYENE